MFAWHLCPVRSRTRFSFLLVHFLEEVPDLPRYLDTESEIIESVDDLSLQVMHRHLARLQSDGKAKHPFELLFRWEGVDAYRQSLFTLECLPLYRVTKRQWERAELSNKALIHNTLLLDTDWCWNEFSGFIFKWYSTCFYLRSPFLDLI